MLRSRLLLGILTDKRLLCQQFLGGFNCEGSSLDKVLVHRQPHGTCQLFLLGFQQLSSERGTSETLYWLPGRVLVVQITAFLPSVEELGFPHFYRGKGLFHRWARVCTVGKQAFWCQVWSLGSAE
jgi:hypothetical protein